jgi:glycosyltransferase involved in cell wall biosynthesis
VDPAAVTVVHQGVDHDTYRPVEQSAARERLGLDPSARYVLVVASNATHKRMDLARTIFAELRARDEEIQLLKAGYGEALAGDGIRNIGWLAEEDMPLLYNAADVYLHPSEYEGFGLPVLEAMACGVPVVANECASIPEFTPDEGRIDLSTSSPHDVADRVIARMEAGRDEAAIERSREFTWERTARKTFAVYERVIAR